MLDNLHSRCAAISEQLHENMKEHMKEAFATSSQPRKVQFGLLKMLGVGSGEGTPDDDNKLAAAKVERLHEKLKTMDPPDAELQDELRARIAALKAERPQADYTWSFADDKIRGSTSRVGIMLRRGWEASLQQVKDHIINLGVVAALLLSVILGLAVEAPEPVESDDRLADARPRIREAFICLCMLSSVFSITAVAVSVFYVEHVDKVVRLEYIEIVDEAFRGSTHNRQRKKAIAAAWGSEG